MPTVNIYTKNKQEIEQIQEVAPSLKNFEEKQ